nr:hypothetical protein [Methanothrix sp.]
MSRSNRPTRDEFSCVCCGFSGPADTIAARNIAARVKSNKLCWGRTRFHLQHFVL